MRLKLVSPKDTLIGHLDVPDHWDEWLKRGGAATSFVNRPFRFAMDAQPSPVLDIKKITVAQARWSQYRDAVWLAEGSIEELEELPGCSFTPSMAYLRSQLG